MKFKRSFLRTSNHSLPFLLFLSSSLPFPYQFLDRYYSRNNIFERKLASKREISRIHGAARQFSFPPHWPVASSPVAGLTLSAEFTTGWYIIFKRYRRDSIIDRRGDRPTTLPINPSLLELQLNRFGGKRRKCVILRKDFFFFFWLISWSFCECRKTSRIFDKKFESIFCRKKDPSSERENK